MMHGSREDPQLVVGPEKLDLLSTFLRCSPCRRSHAGSPAAYPNSSAHSIAPTGSYIDTYACIPTCTRTSKHAYNANWVCTNAVHNLLCLKRIHTITCNHANTMYCNLYKFNYTFIHSNSCMALHSSTLCCVELDCLAVHCLTTQPTNISAFCYLHQNHAIRLHATSCRSVTYLDL